MSFRAVVMRDPTVLLCAFSNVIADGRTRRSAGRRRSGHGRRYTRYRSKDERRKCPKADPHCVESGYERFWRRDPWRQPDIRGMRLIGVRLCRDDLYRPFCRSALSAVLERSAVSARYLRRLYRAGMNIMFWVFGNGSVAPKPVFHGRKA